MLRLLSLAIVLTAIPVAAQPNIVGDWSGDIDLAEILPGAGSQAVIFHVSENDDGFAGTFDIPEQGQFGLPLSDVMFDGESFSANLDECVASYSGVFYGDCPVIVGRITQYSYTVLLVLTPCTAPD